MTTRPEGDPLDQLGAPRPAPARCLTIDLGPLAGRRRGRWPLHRCSTDPTCGLERCVARAAGNPLFLGAAVARTRGGRDDAVPAIGPEPGAGPARPARPGRPQGACGPPRCWGSASRWRPCAPSWTGPATIRASSSQRLLVRPVGEGLLFAHALIRDAVYDMLLRKAPAPRAAPPCRRAGSPARDAGPPRRAPGPRRGPGGGAGLPAAAARRRRPAYRNEAALGLAGAAWRLPTSGPTRFALACLAGDMLHDLGAAALAPDGLRRALDVAADDAERCRARFGLAAVKRVTDRLDGALADLTSAEGAAAVAHGLAAELARSTTCAATCSSRWARRRACASTRRRSGHAAGGRSPELEARPGRPRRRRDTRAAG